MIISNLIILNYLTNCIRCVFHATFLTFLSARTRKHVDLWSARCTNILQKVLLWWEKVNLDLVLLKGLVTSSTMFQFHMTCYLWYRQPVDGSLQDLITGTPFHCQGNYPKIWYQRSGKLRSVSRMEFTPKQPMFAGSHDPHCSQALRGVQVPYLHRGLICWIRISTVKSTCNKVI
jgi:hypothetical protein